MNKHFVFTKVTNRSAKVDLKVSILINHIANYNEYISTCDMLYEKLKSEIHAMKVKGSYHQPWHTVLVEQNPEQDTVEVWRTDAKDEKKYMMWRIVKV